MQAANGNQALDEVLKSMPEVTAHLSAEEIEKLLQPEAYLGSAMRFIDRVKKGPDGHR